MCWGSFVDAPLIPAKSGATKEKDHNIVMSSKTDSHEIY
jgi:hypothetical protein